MGCMQSKPSADAFHAPVAAAPQPASAPKPAGTPPVSKALPADSIQPAINGTASPKDGEQHRAKEGLSEHMHQHGNGTATAAPEHVVLEPPAPQAPAPAAQPEQAVGEQQQDGAASPPTLRSDGGASPPQGLDDVGAGAQQPASDATGSTSAAAVDAGRASNGSRRGSAPGDGDGPASGSAATSNNNPHNTWDKAKLLFSLTKPEELLIDLHDLKYIGAGGYGKVFKAVWRSAPVAVKLVPSHSPELFKSSSYKEALLCKELCHPNIVQTYETRCAQLSEEFVQAILMASESPLQAQKMLGAAGGGTGSYGSQEFVSGDGFGLPSPVPDMVVQGKTLPEAAAKWKDILFTTGAKAGDYLTVIVMDYCDYGSLVRPIVKGMFRPFSASGSDREARVRYRALLRTAKEIAQGLEHLHYLQVVHGDLKPGNVLLKGSRGDVRGFTAQVIDFGLSHWVNNSNPQKVSKAGGTLVYAAPEVFSGCVGKAADVYSLGIILWEMVTGSQPYKDMVEGQIVLGVQKGGLRPAWPIGQLPQLQDLYERCVAQDAELRPKAKEVVQYLTQIEMDLRSELRAAAKQAQAVQMASALSSGVSGAGASSAPRSPVAMGGVSSAASSVSSPRRAAVAAQPTSQGAGYHPGRIASKHSQQATPAALGL